MMTLISDLKQFSGLVAEFKKRYPKAETNCLLMPGEISDLCSNSSLFVSQTDGFLKILCDRGDYFAFYFYADKSIDDFEVSDVIEKAGSSDILIDCVVSEKRGMTVGFPVVDMTAQKIINGYKTYQRMSYCNTLKNERPLPIGYKVETDRFDYDEIMSLWKDALDERSTPLTQRQELEEMFALKRVLTVTDADGRLSAAGILNVSGRQAVIQHVAVNPADRRKGLAGYILGRLIQIAEENNIRILRLWVDRDNLPAVALYNRDGFSPDGLVCKQYIFKRRT